MLTVYRYAGRAETSGARILFSSGLDSIPSELGVMLVQHHARARFGRPAEHVLCRLTGFSGKFSNGTIASGAATRAAAAASPAVAELLADPFALTPGFTGPAQPGEEQEPTFDDVRGEWTAPFVKASINTRNVPRSNFLQGHPYGAGFSYEERVSAGPGGEGRARAEAIIEALSRETGDGQPKPGQGPTRAEQEAGYYDCLFVGLLPAGERMEVTLHGDRDPGYGPTSKIIAETAVFLLQRGTDVPGGIWTPGAALGLDLADWLQDHAGLSYSVR